MREIKFRALDAGTNEWLYFTLQDLIVGNASHNLRLKNWCRFTGLLDKNNKEIYEGDIISVKGHTHADTFTSTVAYRRGGFVFDDKGYYIGDYKEYMLEVIGNVYEKG